MKEDSSENTFLHKHIKFLENELSKLNENILNLTIENSVQTSIAKENANKLENLQECFEEIKKELEVTKKERDELKIKLAETEAKLKEADDKLHTDSHNSSLPPSSDLFGPTNKNKENPENKDKPIKQTQSLRKKSEKTAGGQTGHSGSTKIINHVDNVVTHCNSKCSCCPFLQQCMANNAKIEDQSRYTVDIIIHSNVTEHKTVTMKKCLLSGETLKGEFPEGVNSHIQYGTNLSSFVVLLNHFGLSCERIQNIVSNTFDINLSQGTIINKIAKCASIMEEAVDEIIKPNLCNSNIVHADETSLNINAKKMWVHSSSNDNFTFLTLNEKRGKDGISANGVISNMKETSYVVHDCWASYFSYKNVNHVLCNQHIMRELTFINERFPEQIWAQPFLDFLIEMKNEKERLIKEEGRYSFEPSVLKKYSETYDKLIDEANLLNPDSELKKPARGACKKTKSRNLYERLKKYKDAVMMFAKDFNVPFTNNLGEASFRVVKVKMKNVGCFRSKEGAEWYLTIRSFLDTARKQGKNIFDAIKEAFNGNTDYIFSTIL